MTLATSALLRLQTDAEVEAFWADGAIVLRNVLDPVFVFAMREPVAQLLGEPELVDMTELGTGLAATGETVLRETSSTPSPGRFRSGVDHWLRHEAFARFARGPALPALAAALLRASKLNLWEASVLVKEPGAGERTAWHQDLSYFHVTGEQVCTTWVPLDVVDAESGAMVFARGSHRWSSVYRPNMFVSTMSIPGTDGGAVPDVDALAAAGEVEIVQWDLGPGDVSVHHARTLHAAGPNRSRDRWRRAISVRYCGNDARYRIARARRRSPTTSTCATATSSTTRSVRWSGRARTRTAERDARSPLLPLARRTK